MKTLEQLKQELRDATRWACEARAHEQDILAQLESAEMDRVAAEEDEARARKALDDARKPANGGDK